MSGLFVAIVSLGGALALLFPPRSRLWESTGPSVVDFAASTSAPVPAGADGPLRRLAWLWGLVAGAGAASVIGGPSALVVGVAVAVTVARAAARLEPAGQRREREAARRDLPHVVSLLASALRAGGAPGEAIELVGRALDGPAADRLLPWAARLRLGADPATVWTGLAADPALGPLGRTLGRAHRSGAPVADAVEALAAELADRARAEVEDRARAVGVRAAVPLGVCLLPAFVLVGIVPMVVGLAGTFL